MNEPFILLVEDNEDDIELTQRSFERNNMANKLAIVRDGEAAVQYLSTTKMLPVVILLDLKLPKLNGIQVLQWMRQNPATKYIPVVILTTSNEERDKLAGYDSGANSYVRKPVDFEQFHQATLQMGLYWLVLNQLPSTD